MDILLKVAKVLADPDAKKIHMQFEGLPPGPNQKNKNNWRENAASNARWRQNAKLTGIQTQQRVVSGLAILRFHISLGGNYHVDYDNLAASMKHVQDGLVDARVIRGDTVDDVLPLVTVDKKKPRGFTLDIYSLD